MRRSVLVVLLGGCIGATSSCERAAEDPGADVPIADSAPVGDSRAPVDSVTDDHADHAPRDGEPAPLLVIMRKLDADMLALTHALMTDDRDGVVRSAASIAAHAPIAAEDLARIRQELGDDMAEFEQLDEEVHEASLRLSESAESGQMYEVIDQLAEVQRGCIACHTLYRVQLLRQEQ